MNGEYIGSISISVTSANVPFIGVEYSIRDSSTPSVRGNGSESTANLPVVREASTIVISVETEVDTGVVVEDEEGEVSEIKTYTAEFECTNLPTDTFLVEDIEASSSEETKIVITLKVSFESYENALVRKQTELAQLNKSISELKENSRKIRETNKLRKSLSNKKSSSSNNNNSSGNTNSKVKKSKPTRAGAENGKASLDGDSLVSKDRRQSTDKRNSFTLAALSQYALLGGALAIEYRAFILFPLAAAAIYFRGEVMSV